MFRYLDGAGGARQWVTITIDGEPFDAREAETLAAAMLRAGLIDFRTTPVAGKRRGPYCMMGVCFDCLVTIDDQPDQQACMRVVRPGMRVERQAGAAGILGFGRSMQGTGS